MSSLTAAVWQPTALAVGDRNRLRKAVRIELKTQLWRCSGERNSPLIGWHLLGEEEGKEFI